MPNPNHLSPKQIEALDALLSGATVTDAASAAGVHRSTLHNWCRESTVFRAALRDAQSQQASTVLDGLRALTTTAIDALSAILKDPTTPSATRLRAATQVIQTVAKSDPYTQPIEPRMSTADFDNLVEASFRTGGEEQSIRTPAPIPSQPVPAEANESANAAQIARNAPCPCGSGDKFKRCCGRQAPGLVRTAQAA